MNLQTFDFKGAGIRTVEIDGEIHFVAKDICDALGYSDVTMTLQKLDEDEYLTQKVFGSGQAREMNLLTDFDFNGEVSTFQMEKPRQKADDQIKPTT